MCDRLICRHLISSYLISSHLISSHLILCHLISSHVISSYLISSHIILSYIHQTGHKIGVHDILIHSNNSLPPACAAAAAINSDLKGLSAACAALHAEGTLHMAAREKHPLLQEIQSLMRPASPRCRRSTLANRLLLPASHGTHIDVSTNTAPSAPSDVAGAAPELDCNSAAVCSSSTYCTVT